MKIHNCSDELRSVHLRITPMRLKVLNILERTDFPLDVATIRSRMKADKVTIFRILNSFTQKGILRFVQFNEGKLRYEYANRPAHHHFMCESCGKVIDIEGCVVKSLEKRINQKKGVLVKRHSLEFFGLCADCQK